jgi:hypothetical protein
MLFCLSVSNPNYALNTAGMNHLKIVGLAVRIFPVTTRTFTKDTALSEQGRATAWHVWINARYCRGTAWARHAMFESAFNVLSLLLLSNEKLEPTGTWTTDVWQCCLLCYGPAILFRNFTLIARLFPRGRCRRTFKNVTFLNFCMCEIL